VQNGFKRVNLTLVKLKMAIVFPNTVSKFKQGKSGTVIKGDQYVSRTMKLKDYIALFQATLLTVTGYSFARNNSVRIYKCPLDFTVEKLEAHISAELKDCNYYDDPLFELKEADYLDPEKFDTIEDCMIEPDQLIVLDAKEHQKTWCVKNPNFPMEGKCEGCYNY
jgi:ubiquitin carboxyl-terminal hydrolase 4/11